MPEPVVWSKNRGKDFQSWILQELEEFKSESEGMRQQWMKWIRRYENQRKRTTAAFEGGSNLRVPISQIGTDAVYARIMNTTLATPDLYSLRSLLDSEHAQNLAGAVENELHRVLRESRFRKEYGNVILGTLKLGTHIIKTPHVLETRRERELNEITGQVETTDVIRSQGPKVQHVPVFDFATRTNCEIDDAPWVSHRSYLRWGQLMQRVYDNKFPKGGVDKIKHAIVGEVPEEQIELEQYYGYERLLSKTYEIQEVWAHFDVDGDGREESIVSWIEPSTGTIIHTVHNWYKPNLRPFRAFRYIRRENSFWGKGIPEILQFIQDEIDTIHDQRIDAASIANLKMFKARKGSGVKPKTKVYPGKIFMLTDPDRDLVAFDLGDKGQDSIPHERMAMEYAQLSLGLSDYNLGKESPGMASRATATSTIALIQQGQNRFDLTIDELRDELVELAYDICDRVYQFGIPEGVMESLDPKQQELLREFIDVPQYAGSRKAFGIVVTTNSAKANKEIDKQNQVELLGIYSQFAERLMGTFGIIVNPETPPEIRELATDIAKGMQNILKKIFDAFAIPDASELIPDLGALLGEDDARQGNLQAAIQNSGVPNLSQIPPGGANGGAPAPGLGGPVGAGAALPPGTEGYA